MMAADDVVTGPIEIGNPEEMPILALAKRIIALTGSRVRIVHRPLPQDDRIQRCLDISRARQILNWSPRVGLDEGLRRIIAYFQALLSEGQASLELTM